VRRHNALWTGLLSLATALSFSAIPACSTTVTGEETSANESDLISDSCPETPVAVSWMQTETLAVDNLKVRVGTMGEGAKGDVLFLHGFADRFDNHEPLFRRFVEAGLRVIAFDYPSHGETCGTSLNAYDFSDLADLAGRVERTKTRNAPLYLSGWSTGGLLSVRMAQGISPDALSRPISGMALFAPGVDVRTVLSVSEETLTRNTHPPHVAPPSPSSPAFRPLFAAALLINEQLSGATVPATIPTLVVSGGETEDRYVVTRGVVSWAEAQRADGGTITGLSCAGGYHELDNEPEPMGQSVRDAAATFLASGGASAIGAAGGCTPY
jgi:alpha-beta hydrolase superfamily lysophospholipase